MQPFINLIQAIGKIIQEINMIFYFPLKIDTYFPWGVLALMYLLYRQLKEYMKDQILTSGEFLKLLGTYCIFLSGIVASYVDFEQMVYQFRHNTKIMMLMILILGFMSVAIGIMGTIREARKKTIWILTALYFPIVLLMLTGGRILTEGPGIIRSYMPKIKVPFLSPKPPPAAPTPSSKYPNPYCLHYVHPKEIEEILKKYTELVKENQVIVVKEGESLFLCAFVVLNEANTWFKQDGERKDSIRRFIKDKLLPEEYYKVPSRIEFVNSNPNLPMESLSRVEFNQLIKELKDKGVLK